MALLAHGLPPAADRLDGESGGVMICADTHPALVVVDVVDAIGNGTAKLRVYEVVDVDELRASLTTPFLAGILEIAHQLVSRPVETHHQPLAELCMKLSLHTAPIRQTRRFVGAAMAFVFACGNASCT